MRLEYDPTCDAAYLRLRERAVVSTEEVAPGVLMDVGEDGRPVGIELLRASTVFDGPPEGVEFRLLSEPIGRSMPRRGR
ncbi:MAG: DUF2283 domain-containing protein [Chloroflexi bacterium]|nr:DUF2283 domain-containing protein [Chloroflexota bacterium]